MYENGQLNTETNGTKKKLKPVYIFLIILAAVVILAVLAMMISKEETAANVSGDHIAVVHLEGTIGSESDGEYDHEWLMTTLDELIENKDNMGLVLYVDSPGGAVYETDEIYLKLLEYKETGRPYYVYMGGMAASGGYYVSAPADKIYANRNCWTGSIGVTMGTMVNFSGLLEKYGVTTETITSGDNKAMGSSFEPMTDEQRAIMQSLVDEAYEQFVGIVAEGRGMDVEAVKAVADGRIYTAKQAMDCGLVDQIGTLEEAIADMQSKYDLEDCEQHEFQYEDDSMLGLLMAELQLANEANKSDIQLIMELMESQAEMPISYLSPVEK